MSTRILFWPTGLGPLPRSSGWRILMLNAPVISLPDRILAAHTRRVRARARREAIRVMVRHAARGLDADSQAVIIREALAYFDHGASVWRAVMHGEYLVRRVWDQPGLLDDWRDPQP